MANLQRALRLLVEGDGSWQAKADPAYAGHPGMFGGWTAAVALRAVLDHASRQGDVAAFTLSFLRPIPPGSDVRVATTLLNTGRSIQHWQVDLTSVEDARPLASGLCVSATRRDTDGFTEPGWPDPPDPDSLEEIHPPGEFGKHVLVRPALGVPYVNQSSTRSTLWVRETSGRNVDAVQLAFLSDAYPPRILYVSEEVRPTSTLTISIYFLASEAELEEVGDDYILNEAVGTRGVRGIAGQQARLWSRSGALLATTEQLQWYQ